MTTAAVLLASVATALLARVPPSPPLQVDREKAAALRTRGLNLGYNHDYADAFATFKEAIAADPENPAAYRLLAASAWVRLLFEQGAVTVEDYLGQTRASQPARVKGGELDHLFHDYLNQSIAIAEQRVREHPSDADAHYQLGAGYAFVASYTATVEGRVMDSLKSARRAYREHERTLELDPSRKDAGLVVGMYRYIVANLSMPLRLGAYLAGFGGDRARGLRMVEEAARYPSDAQTNAMFMLVLFYNREGRFADALTVIGDLQRRYPRNRLLWLEAGNTALRAGRAAEARIFFEDGLGRLAADTRPRAPGEESRWRYGHGASLVALGEIAPARTELTSALAAAIRDGIRGRIHKELGKLADLEGDRARAVAAYREADRLCRSDRDEACTRDMKTLIKTGYRRGVGR
ncbi:MAG TPA: tetratricopeptide repeat protein [Vicinamibacterales bacterium]|nr:tetratricopeptide repeat protein [Vicinamibacterales bacterium]